MAKIIEQGTKYQMYLKVNGPHTFGILQTLTFGTEKERTKAHEELTRQMDQWQRTHLKDSNMTIEEDK